MNTLKMHDKDHGHFTNFCCVCRKNHTDANMVSISIERNNHFELDYACCFCVAESNRIESEHHTCSLCAEAL